MYWPVTKEIIKNIFFLALVSQAENSDLEGTRNISVKLFPIWTIGSGGDVV